MSIKNVVNDAKEAGLKVNADFENGIDPLLGKWEKSKVSGWISVGFGVALLAIGGLLGVIFS